MPAFNLYHFKKNCPVLIEIPQIINPRLIINLHLLSTLGPLIMEISFLTLRN